MKVFEKLLKNVETVQKALPSIVLDIADQNSHELIDLNVEQLSKGLTNKGELIKPGYVLDSYAQYKRSIGSKAPFGTPDLILEGDFTGSFFTTKKSDGILIDSSDIKTGALTGKYKGAFGLNPASESEFNKTLIPETLKIITNGITNGM